MWWRPGLGSSPSELEGTLGAVAWIVWVRVTPLTSHSKKMSTGERLVRQTRSVTPTAYPSVIADPPESLLLIIKGSMGKMGTSSNEKMAS